jgi:hypothetical protein
MTLLADLPPHLKGMIVTLFDLISMLHQGTGKDTNPTSLCLVNIFHTREWCHVLMIYSKAMITFDRSQWYYEMKRNEKKRRKKGLWKHEPYYSTESCTSKRNPCKYKSTV